MLGDGLVVWSYGNKQRNGSARNLHFECTPRHLPQANGTGAVRICQLCARRGDGVRLNDPSPRCEMTSGDIRDELTKRPNFRAAWISPWVRRHDFDELQLFVLGQLVKSGA